MTASLAITGLVCLIVGVVAGWFAHHLTAGTVGAATIEATREQSAVLGDEVNDIVEPLRHTLTQLSEELRRTENNRIHAYAGLTEQVRGMAQTSVRLQEQTSRLAGALHAPQIRGRWGEVQLERIVELSGMSRHCDFTTQQTVNGDDRRLRPDLVVHLAGGRTIVVDAKAPLSAYLEATAGAPGPVDEATLLTRHAQAVRSHVTTLSAKSYWAAQQSSPEFVVLFLPGDGVLEAATRADPTLLDYSFARNVVLATPSTLIALLRTVALGWRQHALAEDAATIHTLGRQLYQRLDGVLGHLEKTGSALRRAVESYNSAIGAIDSRLSVTARRLSELEALGDVGGAPSPPRERLPVVDVAVRTATCDT
ncbi:DNA recombination protein RmuC [Gordonia alkaliphila]|uniref:DNA recombination protein RmuC n=1 Tax=Gordonia alkaliphila TaxID=1053547 RepID=UPI001FF46A1B|nr:DNA recombination protein RmuC [Gordonia alkaliphila]MCK0438170.1 DNA recombination protein RmuC [Gordonia alkaliphila]